MTVAGHEVIALPEGFTLSRYDGDQHEAMEEIRLLRALCWPHVLDISQILDDGFDSPSFLDLTEYAQGGGV